MTLTYRTRHEHGPQQITKKPKAMEMSVLKYNLKVKITTENKK